MISHAFNNQSKSSKSNLLLKLACNYLDISLNFIQTQKGPKGTIGIFKIIYI